ncbi:hypothetical protein [Lactococcus lactis]|uniref:hypothetical protein n=1 Tax=Lactococcus lactis TaxID=1358 RepID=UPI00384ACC5C
MAEYSIVYGIIGKNKFFYKEKEAISYALNHKLPCSSVYLILPPEMTQKMTRTVN